MAEENEEKVKVEEELYVNDATLELLQRRIESNVKSNFFRSVGLPVGGAGILAILFGLFYWGPQTIQDYVSEDEAFQQKLQQTVLETTREYLGDPESGREVVRSHVAATTVEYLKDEESGQKVVQELVRETARANLQQQVAAYFEKPEGQEFLRNRLAEYFGTNAGQKQLAEAVRGGLASNAVQKLITQTISREIQPFADRVQQSVSQHKDDLVTELLQAKVTPDPEGYDVVELPGMRAQVANIPKGGVSDLRRFLKSPEADQIARSGRPMALTFRMFSGAHYVADAIDTYLDELKERFGEQFAYCLILEKEGRFVALATVKELGGVMSRPEREEFVSILNASAEEMKPDQARWEVGRLLGTVREPIELRPELTVLEALRSPEWMLMAGQADVPDLEEGLPLVDASGSFEGVLTRGHLIAGLLRG